MDLTRQEKLATSILILTLGIGFIARAIQRSEVALPDEACISKEESIVGAPTDTLHSEQADFIPMDINSASVEDLVLLPGIGPKKAQAIVDWRNRNGRFLSVDDLLKVKGIGPKTLESIKPFVTVGDASGRSHH